MSPYGGDSVRQISRLSHWRTSQLFAGVGVIPPKLPQRDAARRLAMPPDGVAALDGNLQSRAVKAAPRLCDEGDLGAAPLSSVRAPARVGWPTGMPESPRISDATRAVRPDPMRDGPRRCNGPYARPRPCFDAGTTPNATLIPQASPCHLSPGMADARHLRKSRALRTIFGEPGCDTAGLAYGKSRHSPRSSRCPPVDSADAQRRPLPFCPRWEGHMRFRPLAHHFQTFDFH